MSVRGLTVNVMHGPMILTLKTSICKTYMVISSLENQFGVSGSYYTHFPQSIL